MTYRKHLTYANVMATVAVVLALGVSTSYAAEKVKLPKNSVSAKQIKSNAVRADEIQDGAVGAAEIANGAVNGSKLDAATLASLSQPRAYGAFLPDGTLIPSRSKNVTVTRLTGGDPGRYCVVPTGVDALTTTIVVTPDYGASNGIGHFAQGFDTTDTTPALLCPSGGFSVITHELIGGVATPSDVGVSFIIP
jgi:hypothetical protein